MPPSVNSRLDTMPLTCGRTSATSQALVRPGSSRVIVTGRVWRVATVTAGFGGSPPCSPPPQAASTAAARRANIGRARRRVVVMGGEALWGFENGTPSDRNSAQAALVLGVSGKTM